MSAASGLQGDVEKMVSGVFASRGFENDFQVADTAADGFELVCVDDRCVLPSGPLTVDDFCQKILILTEKHASEHGCPIQQIGVGQTGSAIILGSQNIEALAPQGTGDGQRDKGT